MVLKTRKFVDSSKLNFQACEREIIMVLHWQSTDSNIKSTNNLWVGSSFTCQQNISPCLIFDTCLVYLYPISILFFYYWKTCVNFLDQNHSKSCSDTPISCIFIKFSIIWFKNQNKCVCVSLSDYPGCGANQTNYNVNFYISADNSCF